MAKQLNVSLAFTADTSQAKSQLMDLQKQLTNILNTPSNKLNLTDDIREAISATAELSSRLQQATNVNTGNLDFSKFNHSLKQSGQSLTQYGQQLQKLGPAGQQAFLTLTKSIASAEVPIKRTNALVKEFATTLSNTARWQFSSSMLHGFMGAMQSAYRYAQDLNSSLNDIRIVTGQSEEQMARFAAQANAAAKALNATTVEYTNASLIFYQQGLNDQQVKERTDITIKMANVSKQSAEIVSDQMTAVWNNFYDGSKSLEYYADVMTALGAATASSADEIAGGLEKFAAIGETIGLSYEYAAAALATITSNTRQSEEVVGTALKTIFARIQGLNLGETLEDGVTLNKYSQALQKVGISIFESNGELKKMDSILDEMGSKWGSLNKAQQTALAQTVAGVRQYNQLVSLMDNWNKGDADSMQANLATAYGSSGALQEQADIYAESWEAARDRVTAAAEKIYGELLNDDFFIDMLNGFEKILNFVGELIDNLGGVKGVLLSLGAIVTKVFSAQMSQGLTNMAYNLKMMTKSGRQSIEKERQDFIANAADSIQSDPDFETDVDTAQKDSLTTELTLQAEYLANAEKMSVLEAETNKKLIERTRLLKEQTVELEKQKANVKSRVSDNIMDIRGDIGILNAENAKLNDPNVKPVDFMATVQPQIDKMKTAFSISPILKDMENATGKAFAKLKSELAQIDTSNLSADIQTLVSDINKMGDSPDPEQLKAKLEALNLELDKAVKTSKSQIKGVVSPETGKKVESLTQDLREQAQVERELTQARREGAEAQEAASRSIANAKGAQKQWSDSLVETANAALSAMSAIQMINGAIDQLKDPDASGWDKFITILMTAATLIPTLVMGWKSLQAAKIKDTVVNALNAASERVLAKAKEKTAKASKKAAAAQDAENREQQEGIATDLAEAGTESLGKGKGGGKVPKTGGTKTGATKLTAGGAKLAGSLAIAAAGILVLAGTISWVIGQMNQAEKALEKAKASAQELQQNYEAVKQTQEEFNTQSSAYETAREGIENLTKGTEEYEEAVRSANETAMELLETNKNLSYTIENGQIIIDPDSLQKQKDIAQQNLEYAQAAKLAGQVEVNRAKENLQKRDMARSLKSDADKTQKGQNALWGAIGAGIGAGAAAGGIAGAVGGGGVFSVPAGIIGAIVGALGGAITGIVTATSTEDETDALDALQKAYLEDETIMQRIKDGTMTEAEWDALQIEDEALRESLRMNADEVTALVQEMAANTAAINAQNDLVAANALSNNDAVKDSDYQDEIIDIAGDAYGHAYEKAM